MLIYEQFTTCFGQNYHLQVYISKLNIIYNVKMLFVTTSKLLKFCVNKSIHECLLIILSNLLKVNTMSILSLSETQEVGFNILLKPTSCVSESDNIDIVLTFNKFDNIINKYSWIDLFTQNFNSLMVVTNNISTFYIMFSLDMYTWRWSFWPKHLVTCSYININTHIS
jgi:hypothetical protein